MPRIALFALCMLLSPLSLETRAAECDPPAKMADGWPVSSSSKQGLDTDLMCAIGARLRALPEAAANGVVVARHGVLVYEQYFTGPDQRWPELSWGQPVPVLPHGVESKHDISSATKSVVALLVGAALDRELLKGLDAAALDFFPEYPDLNSPERRRVTVQDFLTMRAGLRWIYHPYLSFWRRINAAPNPYELILAQPVTATPGTEFRYNNGSADLVGAIVQRAGRRPLGEFAKDALFDPLGITDWEWGRMANGDLGASWGLRLRLRDFAKIGQLVLDHGEWRGRRIVSAAWITDMTAPHVTLHDGAYGYFWWLNKKTIGGRQIDLVEALGWGGQNLYVAPELDMVIAVNAGVFNYEGGGPQGLAGDTASEMALRAALGG
jgi:CubicO group peptidase (beta-lactamase class C family)